MRYSNSELFEVTEQQYQSWLDTMTAREFFQHCERTIAHLVSKSVDATNWNEPDVKHLRNYRLKAIEFYRQKRRLERADEH